MSVSPYIIDAGRASFEDAVLKNSAKGPVLVNYWKQGAGPCLRQWSVLEKLANDYAGKFLLVNICTDDDGPLAREYGVNSVPTAKLFINGEVVETVHGAESEPHFRSLLDRYVARDSDADLVSAVQLYQQGKVEPCFAALDKLVLMDPLNTRIPISYAKLLIREQRYQQAYELLQKGPLKNENDEAGLLLANAYFLSTAATSPDSVTLKQILDDDPDNLQAWMQLASFYMMHSDYREAMESLLQVFCKNRDYDDGIAGFCMRTIFTLLGDDNDLVKEFRQRVLEAA